MGHNSPVEHVVFSSKSTENDGTYMVSVKRSVPVHPTQAQLVSDKRKLKRARTMILLTLTSNGFQLSDDCKITVTSPTTRNEYDVLRDGDS